MDSVITQVEAHAETSANPITSVVVDPSANPISAVQQDGKNNNENDSSQTSAASATGKWHILKSIDSF